MPRGTIRTTLTLPVDLLSAVDRAVREGKTRSRNELVTAALRRELAAQKRAAIDAAFVGMGDDPDYRADVETLEREFAQSDWEAFQLGEREYAGDDDATE